MSTALSLHRSSTALTSSRLLGAELANMVHGMIRDLFDPYRPELHYMRGPGPKWRAKHQNAATPTLQQTFAAAA